MSWLSLAWNFLFGWAGIDMLVGFAAVAVAVLLPKQFDFITDLRKWAIGVAVVAFTLTGAIAYGYKSGSDEVRRQWDAALVKETDNGEAARADADRAIGPMPSDRRLLRGDPFNRNSGTDPECK